jgi:hypothetical protein
MVLNMLVYIALIIIVIIVIIVLLKFLVGVLFVLPVAEASFWSTRDGTNYSETLEPESECSMLSTNNSSDSDDDIPMPLPKMH